MSAVPHFPPSASAESTTTKKINLPLDSQSAQNLFSSRASSELRTAWYLSTSFTDLPVIIANDPAPPPPPPPPPPCSPAAQRRADSLGCIGPIYGGACRAEPDRTKPPGAAFRSLLLLLLRRLGVEKRGEFSPEMRRLPASQPGRGSLEMRMP